MSLPVLDALHQLVVAQATPEMSFDLVSMWKTMGTFARLIAFVLAAMSVYSLGVMVERLVVYARSVGASRKYAEQLRELLKDNKVAEAIALSETLKRGHLARVLGVAIAEYQKGMEAKQGTGPNEIGEFDMIGAINMSIERASIRTRNELRRGLGALATVGSTAPFVGLLGTVAGIITAFQAMAATGSGGLGSVSAGIAEALVTTAFGLLVAIPAVMMFNYLTNRVEDMEVDMTDAAHELVIFIMREGR